MSSDEEEPFVSTDLDNRCVAQLPTFFCLHTIQLNALATLLLCCRVESNNNTTHKTENKAWQWAWTNWHNSRNNRATTTYVFITDVTQLGYSYPEPYLRVNFSQLLLYFWGRSAASRTILHSVAGCVFPDCDYIILSVCNADYIIPGMAIKLWLKDILV